MLGIIVSALSHGSARLLRTYPFLGVDAEYTDRMNAIDHYANMRD